MTAHVTSVKTYLVVFGALLLLTLATIGVAYVDLGAFNTPAAIVIAAAKSTLVLVFFMHLGREDRATAISLGAGAFLLTTLIVLTIADIIARITV